MLFRLPYFVFSFFFFFVSCCCRCFSNLFFCPPNSRAMTPYDYTYVLHSSFYFLSRLRAMTESHQFPYEVACLIAKTALKNDGCDETPSTRYNYLIIHKEIGKNILARTLKSASARVNTHSNVDRERKRAKDFSLFRLEICRAFVFRRCVESIFAPLKRHERGTLFLSTCPR
jgi:hypothetical protein